MKTTAVLCAAFALLTALGGAQEGEKKSDRRRVTEKESAPVVEEGDVDPFAGDESVARGSVRRIAPGRSGARAHTVVLRMELYDAKTPTVIALLDSWKVSEGAGALRSQVWDLARTGEAEVAEVVAATVEVGAKHSFESIREYVYPTEYEPGGLGGTELPPKALPPKTLATLLDELDETIIPTAFETRNTGNTLEIEVRAVEVEKEESMWDVALAPESVELAGVVKWGVLGAEMPQFTSFRTSTSLRVRDAEWTLVATQTPRGDRGERKSEVKRMVFLKIERVR